jgi:hypothetical protein
VVAAQARLIVGPASVHAVTRSYAQRDGDVCAHRTYDAGRRS